MASRAGVSPALRVVALCDFTSTAYPPSPTRTARDYSVESTTPRRTNSGRISARTDAQPLAIDR